MDHEVEKGLSGFPPTELSLVDACNVSLFVRSTSLAVVAVVVVVVVVVA